MGLMCTGTSGKRDEPCGLEARYVDRAGRVWCGVHADRAGCLCPPLDALPGIVAYRRALRPAGGTVSREQLEALGGWAKPRDRSQTRAWALRVRELLAESPGRDLASAALQARGEMGASVATGVRRRGAGGGEGADGRSLDGRGRAA